MNILFLTHRLPFAPNRGDRLRAYHMLKEMSRFATVDVFSLVHDDDEAAKVGNVPASGEVTTGRVRRARNLVRGAAMLLSRRPLTHALLDSADATVQLSLLTGRRRPDLVVAYCSGMARFALSAPLRHYPFVLDMVDVDSFKWADYARVRRPPVRWLFQREAATLRRFEAVAATAARVTFVVNERERRSLMEVAPAANGSVLSPGIDLDHFKPHAAAATDPIVVFCGMMDYYPNVQGVIWFARDVWPRVRERCAGARFVVVGANPVPEVRRLATDDPSIDVTGPVAQVSPYLWKSAVAVAPLHIARGFQNKVLEALAAGLPVVVTPPVIEGLSDTIRRGCTVAGLAEPFAEAVLQLLALSPSQRRAHAARADVAGASWDRMLATLEHELTAAAGMP